MGQSSCPCMAPSVRECVEAHTLMGHRAASQRHHPSGQRCGAQEKNACMRRGQGGLRGGWDMCYALRGYSSRGSQAVRSQISLGSMWGTSPATPSPSLSPSARPSPKAAASSRKASCASPLTDLLIPQSPRPAATTVVIILPLPALTEPCCHAPRALQPPALWRAAIAPMGHKQPGRRGSVRVGSGLRRAQEGEVRAASAGQWEVLQNSLQAGGRGGDQLPQGHGHTLMASVMSA